MILDRLCVADAQTLLEEVLHCSSEKQLESACRLGPVLSAYHAKLLHRLLEIESVSCHQG